MAVQLDQLHIADLPAVAATPDEDQLHRVILA
jgi:hypothetical protein